ncbi:hypothetical protein L1987_48822 [Smallanthus sonchifolius]|uniref:Uncharacterized protein n=1 Tax=Smallanthus sonchifolius TaxID=185202 RepID=A0ACB9FT04_9ASTR|nr:hypothetical protein L1987_48822 [Smallanthus sonchifolius]
MAKPASIEVWNPNGKYRVVSTKPMPGTRWINLLVQQDCRVEDEGEHDMGAVVAGVAPPVEHREEIYDPLVTPDVDKMIVKPGCSQDVLKAAWSGM